MKRWIAIVPLAVIAILAGMFLIKSLNREVHFEPNATVGQAAPVVALAPLEGGDAVSLGTAVKGPMLINIFGSWCATCVIEHPVLVSLKARGLPIVGVAWRDKTQNTKNYLLQHGDPFARVLMDPDGKAAIELGITAAPESFLVDANGMIIQKISGAISPEAADGLLKKAGLGT